MKARGLILVVLLLALASPATVRAQEPSTRFERISIEQGLSQATVYGILQDSKGLMWFATEDGLNKYDGYTFTVYKRDPEDPHSLSSSAIRSIYEDSSGTLWIGTLGGGLDKFDRATERFTPYRHDPDDPHSLGHDFVTAIHEDSSGILWIGTEGGGLDEFDRATGQFTHYRHDPADPHSLSHDFVTSIYEDSSGTLWIGTWGGLDRLALSPAEGSERAPGSFAHYRHNPADPASLSHDEVSSIYEDHTGALWVGTNGGGLNKLDGERRKFTHYRHDPDDPHSLSHDEVTSLYEDSSGVLWIGTTLGGLNELVLGQSPSHSEGPSHGEGTQKFNRYQNDPHDPYSLSGQDVISIYEDSSGLLWFGTTFGGLSKLDRKTQRFIHYRHDPDDPHSLGSNTVQRIYEDASGTLWVGTSGPTGGLDRLVLSAVEGPEREKGQFVHYRPDPNDPHSLGSTAVLVIYEDRAGALWVGTWDGGLSQLADRETGCFIHYRHDADDPYSLSGDVVSAIYEDRAGALWVGTFFEGLDKFDRVTGQFTHYRHDPDDPHSLSSNIILSIYEDQAGTFWVGTSDGLNKLDRETGQFTRYYNDPADPRSLSSNAASVIYEDTSGTLWVGTDDGLNKLVLSKVEGSDRATESWIHYTEKDGLANDSIGGILEDEEGNLWLGLNKGVARFDPRTGEVKNYDTRDGLGINEFNRGACFQSQRGEMFFGGVNGFDAFYPADIEDNPHTPPVILTDFQIFNKPVEIGDDSPLRQAVGETQEITLSYRDYVFSFEFAALDYTIPSKNQYAYMLEGFDQDWSYVDSTRRFASYANLPAGAYTFRVKGSNNDIVWNEEGTSIKVTITPPPWETWWAYTLYAVLGVLAVAGFVRYRMRELERKHLKQTMWAVQEERDRIAALLESRRQLVASISHDLRTPVAVVRGHLESAPHGGERPGLEVMLQELDRLQALLDDLFTLSRLEVDRLALCPAPTEVVAVARRAVNAIAASAWQQGKVEVTLETTGAELWAVADEQRLLQVLMNLLHNGVRHTLPGGIVVVGLSNQPEAVVVKVQDTGEGISPEDLPYIWERFYVGESRAGGGTGLGLALVKELTEAMGGTVAVESVPGQGSCFTVTLPHSRPSQR